MDDVFLVQGVDDHCPYKPLSYKELSNSSNLAYMEIYPFKQYDKKMLFNLLSIPPESKGIFYFYTFFKSLDNTSSIDDNGLVKCKLLDVKEELKGISHKSIDDKNNTAIMQLIKSYDCFKDMDNMLQALTLDNNFIDGKLARSSFNSLSKKLGYNREIKEDIASFDYTSIYEDEERKYISQDVDLSSLTLIELKSLLYELDDDSEMSKKVIQEISQR